MILTGINIVVLVIIIVICIVMYMMMNSFAEIIVKFVEQNQEFYKHQKLIISKSEHQLLETKKLVSIVTTLKRVSGKLDAQSKRD